jgi:hypothetical protein
MGIMDQYSLTDRVGKLLGERVDKYGLDALSPPQEVVLLSWWAKGIIDNGGFQFFYEGASNAAQVAEAFDALGFTAAGQAFRESLTLFPHGTPQNDHQERQEWLDSVGTKAKTLFDRLSRVIWAIEDDLDPVIETYMNQHPTHFDALRKEATK